MTGEVVDPDRTPVRPGRSVTRLAASHHNDQWLVLVVDDGTVVAVADPRPTDAGAWSGSDERVLVVPPDDRPAVLREGTVSWTT